MPPVVDYAPVCETAARWVGILRRQPWVIAAFAWVAVAYGLSLVVPTERMTETADCQVCGAQRVRRTWTCGGVTFRAPTDMHDAYGYRAEFGDDHIHVWLPPRRYCDPGTAWGYEVPCRHPVLRPELVMVFAAMEEMTTGFTGAPVERRRAIYRELLSLPSPRSGSSRAEEIRAGLR